MNDPDKRRRDIAAGLDEVRARIDTAARAAGRRDPVRLVVVTKTFPVSDLAILAALGVRDVGENRDQEARAKHAPELPLRWHMIGQLQRNKAASVARWADVVESVDRHDLIAPLGRAAVAAGRTLDVLVQVCLDPAPTPGRGGALPTDVVDLIGMVAQEPGLRAAGVMAVAPHPGAPAEAFARLAEVAARVRAVAPEAVEISAGMSGDLEEAIEHGATQVRVGGAVLGPRPIVQ